MWRVTAAGWTAILASAAPAPAPAQPQPQPQAVRDTVPLSNGWRFHLAPDGEAVAAPGFDDAGWTRVAVPHNWNRMGGGATRGPDYTNVHGIGWYRLHFRAPALGRRHAWLEFDAASIVTDVWLNGVHLGRHAGAFARFRFDATAAMRPGADNLLAVRVDNSSPRTPGSTTAEVIPMSGDWPMYGGLYRPVRLVLTDPVHIAMADYGGPGTYATVVRADADAAQVRVVTRIENMSAASAAPVVEAEAIDAAGRVAASVRTPAATIAAGGRGEAVQTLAFTRPHLWNGTADPYRYRLRVTLRAGDGHAIDRVEQPLGLRSIRFDADRGFFLNGRHLALRGVSRHQDRARKGWAIEDADIDEDYALMREIGANTVRLAHYQHAQHAYDAADRDGLIVWAEIPLVDRSAPWGQDRTTDGFADNAERQLRELIRQNANHPSIVTWSIANEVNLEAAKGRGASHAGPLLERLQRVVHSEDPGRPATLADCCGSVPAEARAGLDTVAGITDVIGYNRYFGWYAQAPEALGPELARLHALYPRQPLSVSEYGAGGALSQHSDDPRGGPIAAFGRPHPEEYQADLLERTWPQIAAAPYVWASWVWNLTDFSNEQRLEGDLTDTNDKGLVTFDRKTRKDAFYYYKANWTTAPFVHLTGRRYVDRPYPIVEVKAYSNQRSVRLRVNGRDAGSAACTFGVCRWPGIALRSGDNRIEATAAGAAPDAIRWRLHGRPATWHIRAGTLSGARGADGTLWGSDVFVTGGEGHFREQPSMSRGGQPGPVRAVAGTGDQAPFGSWRSGNFAYAVPVPDGRYRVTLSFFEPDAAIGPGARVFDVQAQGRAALTAVDVRHDTGGAFRAMRRSVPVDVTGGMLRLAFRPVRGEAIVSAIAIVPEPAGGRREKGGGGPHSIARRALTPDS